MGPKNKNIKQGDKAYIFIPFGLSRRASHLSVLGCALFSKFLGHNPLLVELDELN